MRNGIVLLVIITVAGFTCCKSSKVVKRDINFESSSRVVESTVDKSTKTITTGSQINMEKEVEEFEFSRKTEFDSAGVVRSVQETWWQSGSTQLVVRNDSSRDISLNNVEEVSEVFENEIVGVEESENIQKDGATMKSFGWFWFWMSLGLLIVLYFTSKQFR